MFVILETEKLMEETNMKKILSTLFLSSALLLAACANDQDTTDDTGTIDDADTTEEVAEDTTDEAVTAETVEVTLLNADGEESGTATFAETENGVTLTYDFYNLPEGEFGMHIHETGLATAPDFGDADGHWNPADVEHGVNSETGPHLGDLPNIVVDSSGEVSGEELLEEATLAEDAPEEKYSLHNGGQGTALIVHDGTDDYESQPTGDAGDRQLGGVIIPKAE